MTVTYTDWVRDVQAVQCAEKRPYRHPVAARRAARSAARRRGEPPQDWRAYRCQHGWHYHIGHDRRT